VVELGTRGGLCGWLAVTCFVSNIKRTARLKGAGCLGCQWPAPPVPTRPACASSLPHSRTSPCRCTTTNVFQALVHTRWSAGPTLQNYKWRQQRGRGLGFLEVRSCTFCLNCVANSCPHAKKRTSKHTCSHLLTCSAGEAQVWLQAWAGRGSAAARRARARASRRQDSHGCLLRHGALRQICVELDRRDGPMPAPYPSLVRHCSSFQRQSVQYNTADRGFSRALHHGTSDGCRDRRHGVMPVGPHSPLTAPSLSLDVQGSHLLGSH
jgi:hypothetical protein